MDPNPRRGAFRGVCNTPLHGYVQNLSGFTFPHTDTPKTHPVLGANRRRGTFRGVCFCAPTRVRAKFDRFHISPPEYLKNAPDFTIPNKDAPKTHQISPFPIRIPQNQPGFRPKLPARKISGRMQYAPTRVRTKFGGFHISAHVPAQKRTRFHLSQ